MTLFDATQTPELDPADITIRDVTIRADSADSDPATRLRAAARLERRTVVPEDAPDAPEPAPQDYQVFLVATDRAGNPLGCGGLIPTGDGVREIRRFFVRTDARSNGHTVGRSILHALESEARRAGASALVFETAPQMVGILELFTSFGYRHIDNWGPYFGSSHSFCLAKRL